MTSRQKTLLILLSLLFLALSLRLIGIGNPLFERAPSAWRQIQTNSTAQGYLHHGFKFFYPEVNFMGNPGYFALEFPLYQYTVAWLYKFFGEKVLWGRLLTIATSLGALIYLFFILRRFLGEVAAAAGALYFAVIPLSAYYGRTVMVDVPVLFLSLGFTYHFLSYVEDGHRRSLLWAVILSALAMLIKVTTAVVFLGPLLILPLLLGKKEVYKKWEFYLFICLPLIAAYWWKGHAEAINVKHATITLQYTPQMLSNWVFGPLSMRWDGDFYRFFFGRMIQQNLTWAGIFLAGGGIVLSFTRKELRVLLLYLLAGVGYLLTFTNLNFVHDYYQLPLIPIFAVFIGIFVDFAQGKMKALAQRKNLLTWGKAEKLLAPGIVIILGVLMFIPSIRELEKNSDMIDWEIISTGEQIQKLLSPETLVISITYDGVPKYPQIYIYNCQPITLYAVGHRGWNLNFSRFSLSEAELLKQKGARYLVIDVSFSNPLEEKWLHMIMGVLRNNYKEVFISQRLLVYDLNKPPSKNY